MIDHRSVRRAVAWRLARWQAGLGLGAGVLLAPWGGWSGVLAAGVGGGLQALLTLYVSARLAAAPPGDPAAMLRGFYRAQIGKWLWAVLVFGVAARFAPQWFMPLLAGYGAGLIANWLALRWTPETGPRRRP